LPLLLISEAQDKGGDEKMRTLIIVLVIVVVLAILAYLFLYRGRRRL
jgi:flagellar basal body-associated protein FliL